MQVEVNVQDYYAESFSVEYSTIHDPKLDVSIHYPIPGKIWETWIERWLVLMATIESPFPDWQRSSTCELSLRLTSDAEIQSLNAQYRHIDQPTDVLAFSALEVEVPHIEALSSSMPLYLGDIIISVDTAKQQAQQQHHTLGQELAWLAAHGLLHLLGWDHPDEERLLQMLTQQNTLLTAIGLVAPLS